MLLVSIVLYLLFTIAVGLWAGTKVKTGQDYVVASRSLPLYVVIATVFATWFGSETVLGIPATFMEEGLLGVIGDPFGASLCLVLVGLFFAVKLYRKKLNSIAAYYRQRYDGRVELLTSIAIMLSYVGWVAAQITALGLVFHLVAGQQLTVEQGMVLGAGIVLLYTLWGGMWSVALTDFVQMCAIVIGLVAIAVVVSGKVQGGSVTVFNSALSSGKLHIAPEWTLTGVLGFVGALLTLGFGSIPQQDVFQRVMAAKDEKTAKNGAIIGGVLYFIFAFIPIYIVYAATFIAPDIIATGMSAGGDSQHILPSLIMQHMPVALQVLFFGALLSAIMSTASGTLLAPATVFVENILKPIANRHHLTMSDKQYLLAVRLSVVGFALLVLMYAMHNSGKGIFAMVEGAYKVTLAVAFVPLVAGLYWRKANTTGALTSIAMGLLGWLGCEWLALSSATGMVNWHYIGLSGWADVCPPQLVGLLFAIVGMLVGVYVSTCKRTS